MRNPSRINRILSQVGKALLDKGEDYSVGRLVAELEGDGSEKDEDPYHVWDEHFFQDVIHINDWPDEPRDPKELNVLLDAFRNYWGRYPDLRFCQIVCNAHCVKNGVAEFDPDETPYKAPLNELTDDQLLAYLQNKNE